MATDRGDFYFMVHANVCDEGRQTTKVSFRDEPLIAAVEHDLGEKCERRQKKKQASAPAVRSGKCCLIWDLDRIPIRPPDYLLMTRH